MQEGYSSVRARKEYLWCQSSESSLDYLLDAEEV